MNQAPIPLDAANSILLYGSLSLSDGAESVFVQELEFRGTRVGIFEQTGLSVEVHFDGNQTKTRVPLAEKSVFGVRVPAANPPDSYEKVDMIVFRKEGFQEKIIESVSLSGGSANLGTVVLESA